MWARFIRHLNWTDRAYLNKPVPRKYGTGTGKVYCEGCRWLVQATSGYSCHDESNKLFSEPKNKWLSPNPFFSLREHPKQKNRRNDCPHREVSAV